MTISHHDIIEFWFVEIDPQKWWVKDEAFDQMLRDRFIELHASATEGALEPWREYAQGRVAEIIVLDQFSRNMYRGTGKMFAADEMALGLAKEAVSLGLDKGLSVAERLFLYMPYMHSEDPAAHEEAMKLYDQPGLEQNLDFEIKHKVIIDRFGRYPHRNALLGRESTEEELEFLKEPGSSF